MSLWLNPVSERVQASFKLERRDIYTGIHMTIISVVPLIVGTLVGRPEVGLAGFLSGLYIALADPGGTYRRRAVAMGCTTLGIALAAFVAIVSNDDVWIVIPLTLVGIFCLELLGIYGSAASKVGYTISTVFVVLLAQPGSVATALQESAAFLVGGLWAIVITLWLWPLKPYQPVRDALADYYRALATFVSTEVALGAADADMMQGLSQSPARRRVRDTHTVAHRIVDQLCQAGPDALARQYFFLALQADQLFEAVQAFQKTQAFTFDALAGSRMHVLLSEAVSQLAELLQQVAYGIERDRAEIDLTGLEQLQEALLEEEAILRQTMPQSETQYLVLANVRHMMHTYQRVLNLVVVIVDTLQQQDAAAPSQPLALPERGPGGRRATDRHGALVPRRWSRRKRSTWPLIGAAFETLRDNLTLDSLTLRYALRIAATTTLGVLVYLILRLPRGYWIPMTVLIIAKPEFSTTQQRTLQRGFGTVLGGLVASVLALLIQRQLLILGLLVLSAFLAFLYLKRNYGLYVLFWTPFMVFLIDSLNPGDWQIAFVRMLYTLMGAALTLLSGYFFWPQWERERLSELLARAIAANRVFFVAALRIYLGRPADSQEQQRAGRAAHLEGSNAADGFRRLLQEPRHQRGNTEQVYALVACNRQLCDSLTTLAAHGPLVSGRHTLVGLPAFIERGQRLLLNAETAVRQGRSPVACEPLTEELRGVQQALHSLVESRLAEITTTLKETPTQEAVEDFAPLRIELEHISACIDAIYSAAGQR